MKLLSFIILIVLLDTGYENFGSRKNEMRMNAIYVQ